MIKRCPTCNRTYSDESISFCLADGALLSAPYDQSSSEAPVTEILPHVDVPPTQPANQAVPTMTSLPAAHKYSAGEQLNGPRRTKSIGLLGVIALLGVGILGAAIFFAVRYGLRQPSESAVASNPPVENTNSSPNNAGTVSSPSPAAADVNRSSSSPTPVQSPTRAPTPASKPATVETDPVLYPTDPVEPKARPSATPASDNNDKVFSAREVDQKLQILSRPMPSYTEEARKDQISGVVVLRAVFSSSGQVGKVSVVRGLSGGLTERAIAAAKQIRFTPATKDGHPVSMWMLLEYNFNLY